MIGSRQVCTRRGRGRVVAVVAAGVVALATGCVVDLTKELGDNTFVRAINRRGDRVVTVDGRLARLDADGTKTWLQDLPGTKGDVVPGSAITDDRVVVGFASDGRPWIDGGVTTTVVWDEHGEVTDLRSKLPHHDCRGFQAQPTAVNNAGVIVGQLGCFGSAIPTSIQPFIFDLRADAVRPLPTVPGGGYGFLEDVNDDGVIIASTNNSGARWTPDGSGYRYEHLDFRPDDINDEGAIVGWRRVEYRYQPLVQWAGSAPAVALAELGAYDRNATWGSLISDNGVIVLNTYDGWAPRSVRYVPAEGLSELCPGIGGTDTSFHVLTSDGAAYGEGLDANRVTRAIRWTR